LPQTLTIEFDQNDLLPLLYGEHNNHLHHIENKLGITIADRGNRLSLSGPDDNIRQAQSILLDLWAKLEKNQDISTADIDAEIRFLDDKSKTNSKKMNTQKNKNNETVIKTRKKTISPRSPNQKKYIEMMHNKEMVFGLGAAGTGKTYLAVAVGVAMYLEGKVERLIFTRPAVEAGERLGFLPGDLKEKVDPYLRPIYDAMLDMMPWDVILKKMDSGEIEVAPLAYMRGRTLNNAFVILDEAQNTTTTQMKMFLTRMGESAHMVITGDITQTDLPPSQKSGLRDAVETLEHVKDIGFMHFKDEDVVRHPIVSQIISAYDAKNRLPE